MTRTPQIDTSRRLSIAPMMNWTDRHCRTFHRVLTRRALLYTEMVTTRAIVHGNRERLLGFGAHEHPVALQIGGSEPAECARAARIGEEWGYREINLNVGCPSDRVQSGRFGACLMAEPELVAECVAAMCRAVEEVPVTVKCRIGIDDQDEDEDLDRFVETVAAAGSRTFIVHARKAWLKGLSPKQNRDIPPLNHDRVRRLKARRPDLNIVLNGGIVTLEEVVGHLETFDGVMLGRAAYQSPWLLAEVDRLVFGEPAPVNSPREVLEALRPYVQREIANGTRLNQIGRHMLGLFQGCPGARLWRRRLSETMHREDATARTLLDAADAMEPLVA